MLVCDHWGEHDFPPDSVYHSLKKSYNLSAAYLCNADVQWCCLSTVQPAERRDVGVAGGAAFFSVLYLQENETAARVAGGRCFLAAMPACYPKMA